MFQAFFFSVVLVLDGDVNSLAKQLGDDGFQTREAAHIKLQSAMDFALYAKLGRVKAENPEATSRVRSIRQEFETKFWAKIQPKYKVDLGDYPKTPWICQGFPHDYEWQGLKRDQIKLSAMPNTQGSALAWWTGIATPTGPTIELLPNFGWITGLKLLSRKSWLLQKPKKKFAKAWSSL